MARHAVVDITQVFHKKPWADVPERLSRESFKAACDHRTGAAVVFRRRIMKAARRDAATLRTLCRYPGAPLAHGSGAVDSRWRALRTTGVPPNGKAPE